jgi:hypothetical protein
MPAPKKGIRDTELLALGLILTPRAVLLSHRIDAYPNIWSYRNRHSVCFDTFFQTSDCNIPDTVRGPLLGCYSFLAISDILLSFSLQLVVKLTNWFDEG